MKAFLLLIVMAALLSLTSCSNDDAPTSGPQVEDIDPPGAPPKPPKP
ncbi:MAG TPA: hypothetical protein VF581_02870 [Flavobacterium sp.]